MANKSFVVEYVIRAREKFSASAEKVTRSTKAMKRSVDAAKRSMAALAVKVRIARNRLRELTKFDARGLRNFGAKMAIGVTVPVALMANSFKNAARDAVETRTKFATIFKDISAQSEQSAESLAKNFGLSGTSAKELLGNTGDLLTGLGFTQQGALDLAVQVNELAVDLASFTNFSGGAEGASAALTKALLGERESIKSLGIAIGEKDVKARVAKLLSEGQTFASLRQAKAAATLSLAMEQSKNAIGDFARTSEELANQERITAARIQDLKESFGAILLPAALKLTLAIRGMAEWLTALSPRAQKMILIVAGVVAVLGPLLITIGAIGLAIPAIAAGFAALGVVFTGLGTVAALAFGPIGLAIAAIAVGAILVIKNWEKVKTFFSGLTEIVRQLVAVATSFDLGQFNAAAIKAKFLGGGQTSPGDLGGVNKVDVGVQVGLAPGLQTTGAPQVASTNARRTDVGVGAALP